MSPKSSFVALLALVFCVAFAVGQVTYNVDGSSGPTSYTISGPGITSTTNPALSLVVGTTYNFVLANCATHPFWIKTVQGSGSSNGLAGVTNNGATTGTVTVTPSAAAALFYNCGNHAAMTNTVTVRTATTVSSSTGASATVITWSVDGTNGPTSYAITGTGVPSQANPPLTMTVGNTYNFVLSNCGSHPFWLKSVQGIGVTNGVTGVTNNGATTGTVAFTPTAAAGLFYNCQFHSGMTNTVTVGTGSGAMSSAVPSLVVAALAIVAGAIGYYY